MRLTIGLLSIAILLSAFPAYCQQPPPQSTTVTISKRIDALIERLGVVEAELAEVKLWKQYAEAAIDSQARQLGDLPKSFVAVTAGDEGYSVARTSAGLIAISVKDAVAYPGGHRLRIQLMPLTSVGLLRTSLSITYGRARRKGEDFVKWRNGLQLKQTTASNDLPGSRWTTVEVILAPSRPEEMEYFEISAEPGGIAPVVGSKYGLGSQ